MMVVVTESLVASTADVCSHCSHALFVFRLQEYPLRIREDAYVWQVRSVLELLIRRDCARSRLLYKETGVPMRWARSMAICVTRPPNLPTRNETYSYTSGIMRVVEARTWRGTFAEESWGSLSRSRSCPIASGAAPRTRACTVSYAKVKVNQVNEARTAWPIQRTWASLRMPVVV